MRYVAALILVTLVVFAAAAEAQVTTATLIGTERDSSGARTVQLGARLSF